MNEGVITKEIARWVKAVLDWFFTKPSLLFAVAVVCLVIIGLPQEFQKLLGYDEIVKNHKGYIALIGVISFTFYITWLLIKITKQIVSLFERKLEDRRFTKNGPNILRRLTRVEKEYVAKYIAEDATTIAWPLEDGVIKLLEQQAVAFQAANYGRYMDGLEYALQPWVREVLEENQDLKDEILEHYKTQGTIL